ncbi:polysaccharide pyruvyl transferase family protein [Fibrobacter sp. UWH4]|uniref:polysaccharide pyruvyl transferase family protein n=1 Tax=Fibrobacter sp. UWH4 TaxID=1896210 RepID=UPI0009171511|nr:polysaccharide pyruvyl transferase family protein [Fibrobacter sp. UWH4]SHK66472.1 Polysaccharide pyruvyl transferase family protein WcaK [Fibrobacter sp. UWH4]
MKIVIAEGGPAGNVGSMALIENAIKIAREKHPGCEIIVLSSVPDSVDDALTKEGLHSNVVVMGDLFIVPLAGTFVKLAWLVQCILWIVYTRFLLLFSNKISCLLLGRRKKILKEVESADFVYCIGAERINDIYFKTALLSLSELGIFIKMGKKLVHLSLTIGPVFYRSTICAAKRILNASYAIFVRDQKTFDILKEWHCKAPHIFNSFDIALLQDSASEKTQQLLNEFGIESGFIAVSVIDWLFRKAKGPARMPEYNEAHAKVLDYIVEKYDKNILFTPTVVSNCYKVSDTTAADSVISLMKHKDRVVSIQRLLTPMELAAIYSQCYFGIVTRMHAAILCSGAGGKPIVAVNYLYKLREYMKNIQFEDYSVDIDYVNECALKDFVDQMFLNYDVNLERLNKRISSMRSDLMAHLMSV